ncbi:MAG TPA: ABC transporter permease [Puia sp.]|jgi:putative ABC transport system permease protein|nr:ABC transporter permease [Puia sp.]
MLKSYWKTAIRFLLKNKTFSFINVVGLAMGTVCCLYILLYVREQYSYDRHEAHAEDIYQVISVFKLTGDSHRMATSSPPIAGAIKHDFPEVQQYTRAFNPAIFGADQHMLKYKDRSFYEKEALFVDSTFFQLFTYRWLEGDPARALMEPYSIVLLKPTADKLFGGEDPLGKTILINNKAGEEHLRVTGVIEPLGRSHLQANVFITLNSGLIGRIIGGIDNWAGGNMMYSYVKLRPGADAQALTRKLAPFLATHGEQQLKAIGMEKELHLLPISAAHTTTGLEVEWSRSVSPSFLSILVLIAVLIQVIACINFMNLTTARAFKRAKEVGVRKVIGAGRGNLIRQFLGESLALSFAAILLALPLLWLLMPSFNQLTKADLSMEAIGDYRFWLVLLGLVVGTGLLSGSYPAFYLSAFQATRVIKGNFTNRISAIGLRRVLVVFQFSLSILLISGIVVIYSQLEYIKNKDLGYDRAQKIIFNIYTSGVNESELMAEFRLLPGVKAVTATSTQLGKPIMQDQNVFLAGGNMANGPDAHEMVTDKYFVRAAGIRLASGRDFGDSDSGRVLINETLARRLRLDPAKAPGTKLYSQYDKSPAKVFDIIGVIKDLNTGSLHEAVQPFMLICDPKSSSLCTIMVSCNSSDYRSLLARMEAIWRRNAPGVPYEYAFLDAEVQRQYETEIIMANIINCFTVMAVVISCLGLFGLAAFSAEQRSKEIGIRKVLGASVVGMVRLLSVDFLKLVVLAFVIATPVAWLAMHRWLETFAYRVTIQWWMFGLSGLVALMIAMGTVSFHAIRAAVGSPVRSLRSE